MCMKLVQMVLVNSFGLGQPQDVVRNSVVGVAVEEVGLHPGRVLRVLDKEETEVWMIANSGLDKMPIPVN